MQTVARIIIVIWPVIIPRPLPTDKFWLIAEPAISAQVVGTADAILVENTPSFLDSIRLTTFTMGTKGPRIESVKSYPKTDPNVVVSKKVYLVPSKGYILPC